ENPPCGFNTRARDKFCVSNQAEPTRAIGVAHPASNPLALRSLGHAALFRAQPDKPYTQHEDTGSTPVEGTYALVAQWESASLVRNTPGGLSTRARNTLQSRTAMAERTPLPESQMGPAERLLDVVLGGSAHLWHNRPGLDVRGTWQPAKGAKGAKT